MLARPAILESVAVDSPLFQKESVETMSRGLGFEVGASAQDLDVEACSLQTVPALPLISHLLKVYHRAREYQLGRLHPL